MEIYRKILQYLADNDNGEFSEITHLDSNFKFLNEKSRELQKAKRIELKPTGVYSFGDGNGNVATMGDTSNLSKIKAKILIGGHEYLQEMFPLIQPINKSNGKIKISSMLKEKKIKYIDELIYEAAGWKIFEHGVISSFILKAQEMISKIDSKESPFVQEIDVLRNSKDIINWNGQIINVLERLKFKIDCEEEDFTIRNEEYINQTRINELSKLNHPEFDLTRLIQLCKETNCAFKHESYYSVGILVRTIINHVPPVFGFQSFTSVISNYKSEGNNRSFKETMENLENSSRKIGDSFVHSIAPKKEVLPNSTQVDFRSGLDVLLSEIVRKLK